MSKLIEKLDKASKSSPAPMGFGAAVSREKLPVMLLMGLLRKGPSVAGKRVAEGRWDALLLQGAAVAALDKAAFREAVGDVPWGAWPDQLQAQELEELKKQGCDFLAFPVEGVPLEALEEGNMARVLVVPLDMPEHLLRTLDDLPIDAVLVSLADKGSSPLALRHLMQVAVVRTMTSRYMMVERPAAPGHRELEALRDAGVDILALDAASITAKELERLRSDLRELPQRKPRPEKPVAVVPRLGAFAGPPGRKEEEEVEEEEEEDT